MAQQKYDGALQQFIEDTPRDPNMDRLHFLRWLAETGRLEHDIAGPSCGKLVDPPAEEGTPEYTSKAS